MTSPPGKIRTRLLTGFLLVVALFSPPLTSLAATPELADIVEMWKRKEYLNVVQILKEYREGPYGKTPEVDYMIASSLCRLSGFEIKGQQYFQWLLYNHRLDARSRNQVLEEMRNCASAQAPIVINFVVVRSGAGARVGGKMFYPVTSPDLPVSSVPVEVLRDIPEAEMARRLVPLSDPARGIRTIKELLGPAALVEARQHFLLVKIPDSRTAPPSSETARPASARGPSDPLEQYRITGEQRSASTLDFAQLGNLLEQYLDFFTREFKMQAPTNFITVYCSPDSDGVRKAAEALHGIRVSELSIGYSYRDDLSLVGLFDGTLFHELFHLLAYRNFGDIPPWLDEGLAALYEVSQPRAGRIDGLPNWRGEILRAFRGIRPTVEQLVRMDWRGFDDESDQYRNDKQAVNHAMSRYLMLMLQERNQLSEVYHAFRNRKVEALEDDPPPRPFACSKRSPANPSPPWKAILKNGFSKRSADRATLPIPIRHPILIPA